MKVKNLIIVVFVSVLFVNCAITEKLIINDDNTGKFLYEIDGSALMAMGAQAKKSQNKEQKEPEVVDSIISFKEILLEKKDSIASLSAEEQEKLKKLENFNMHVQVDETKELMKFSFYSDFASIKELQNITSPIKTLSMLNNKKQDVEAEMLPDNDAMVSFFYDGKTFRKKSVKEKNTEVEAKEDSLVGGMDKEQTMQMLYSQSNFKVVYQFPKAVKTISIENAMFSADRKTITIEFPFKEYMENPEALNFEVKFE